MKNKDNKLSYDTLDYYNKNAKIYFEQTIDADMEEVYTKFLKQLPVNSYILDFGCGSGRDSKYFIENGYNVKATDGSIEMCKIASNYIKQDVQCMKFDELDEINTYDGIWACCSILHIEKEKLPYILNKMVNALKPNGIIYASFKKGTGYEIKEGKYYNFMTKEEIEDIISTLDKDAKLIDCYETSSSVIRNSSDMVWNNFLIKVF